MGLIVAPHVRVEAGVLLDGDTGLLYALNATGAGLLATLTTGGGVDECVAALAERFPEVPLSRLSADVSTLVAEMVGAGLLLVDRPAAASVPMAEPAAAPPVRPRGAVASLFLVACAHLLLRMSFPAVCRLVSRSRRTAPPPALVAAEEMVRAVRWAAGRYPGRTACLETSLAVVLWGALRGRRVDWCIGFVTEPYRFHAWAEVGGEPVLEPEVGADHHRLVVL
ncbi:lasso peptide biosynthesis B2 protein [Nonomuraea sp. NPDC050790]|uniref:lasso peptide biosynthesis B2 protein n=1 Tax=Nonomuraea sp. NPDC050790 TaxID=3364371 RepID=UPI00378E9BB4